jgi:hemolysin III
LIALTQGERFNTLSHLAGAFSALVAGSILIARSVNQVEPAAVLCMGIYVASLVLLYTFSTLYHGNQGALKLRYRVLDHQAIYLLIAGSYTPFLFASLSGTTFLMMMASIWSLAIAGALLDGYRRKGSRIVQQCIYLFMGWLCLFALDPIMDALSERTFNLLLAGGLIYTFGIVFYLLDGRVRWFHGVWHLFVLAGSACHFVSVAML